MRPSAIAALLALASLVGAVVMYVFHLSEVLATVVVGILVTFAFENLGWFLDSDRAERAFRIVRRLCQLTFTATLPFVFWHNTRGLDEVWGEGIYGIVVLGAMASARLWIDYVRLSYIAVREFFVAMRWPVH